MIAKAIAKPGAHLTSKIIQIFNSPVPWIVILAAFAFITFGMALSHESSIGDLRHRLLDQQSRYEERIQTLRMDFVDKLEQERKAAIDKEREVRLLEHYVMQTDARLVLRGALKQSETWAARSEKK